MSSELGDRRFKKSFLRSYSELRTGNSKLYLILLIAGSCATRDYKPRQVRKEATVVIHLVCRRGAWLSTGYFFGKWKVEGRKKRCLIWYWQGNGDPRSLKK